MHRIEKSGSLSLTIENETEILVKWEGRSVDREPSIFLTPLFHEWIDSGKKITMDFTELEYMNSSTLSPVLKLLEIVRNSTGSIRVLYSKAEKWQELSFTALEIFKTPDLRIDIIGK